MGSIGSTTRTADETLYALFWQSARPAGFSDPVAVRTALLLVREGFVYCSTHLSMREPYRFAI